MTQEPMMFTVEIDMIERILQQTAAAWTNATLEGVLDPMCAQILSIRQVAGDTADEQMRANASTVLERVCDFVHQILGEYVQSGRFSSLIVQKTFELAAFLVRAVNHQNWFADHGTCSHVYHIIQNQTLAELIQCGGLAVVSGLSRNHVGNQAQLGDMGFCEWICQLLPNYPEHQLLQRGGLETIRNLASHRENQDRFGRLVACTSVCGLLRQYADDVQLQTIGLSAIWDLTLNCAHNQQQCIEMQVCELIAAAMQRYPEERMLQLKACGAIWCLAANQQAVKEQFAALGVCALVYAAVTQFCQSPTIDRHIGFQALGAIANLALNHAANQTRFAALGVCEWVIKMLSVSSADVGLQVQGCLTVWSLASHNPTVKSRLGMRACEQVCQALSRYADNRDVQYRGIGALCALAQGHVRNAHFVGACQGGVLICNALAAYPADRGIQEVGFGAIFAVGFSETGNTVNNVQLAEAGACQLVCRWAEYHPDDPALQVKALGAMLALVLHNPINHTALSEAGACELVCDIMRKRANMREVYESGCGLIWRLSMYSEHNRVRLMAAGACECVYEALTAFPHDMGLRPKGVLAVIYLSHYELAARRWGELGMCHVIHEILSHYVGIPVGPMREAVGVRICQAVSALCGDPANQQRFIDLNTQQTLLTLGTAHHSGTPLGRALREAQQAIEHLVRPASDAGQHESVREAARMGQWDEVRRLSDYLVSESPAWAENSEVLCCAIAKNHQEMAQQLLEKPAVRKTAHTLGNLALCLAAKQGFVAIVQTLLTLSDVRANLVNTTAGLENEVLYWAVNPGHLSVVKLLLQQESIRAAVHTQDDMALLIAGLASHWPIVHELQACAILLSPHVRQLFCKQPYLLPSPSAELALCVPYHIPISLGFDTQYATTLAELQAMLQEMGYFDVPAFLQNLANRHRFPLEFPESLIDQLAQSVMPTVEALLAPYHHLDAVTPDTPVNLLWYSQYVASKHLMQHPNVRAVIGDVPTVLRSLFFMARDEGADVALSGLYRAMDLLLKPNERVPFYTEVLNYLYSLSVDGTDIWRYIREWLPRILQEGLVRSYELTLFDLSDPVVQECRFALCHCLSLLRYPGQDPKARTSALGTHAELKQLEDLLAWFHSVDKINDAVAAFEMKVHV